MRVVRAQVVLSLAVTGPLAGACGEIREVPVGESTTSTESSAATGTGGSTGSMCGIECDDHGSSGGAVSSSTGDSGGGGGPEPICGLPSLPIPDAPARGVMAVIEVPDLGTLADLDVGLRVEHDFVGDLRVTLAHAETSITLVDQPDGGGCAGAGLELVLDDEGRAPIACADGYPAVGGRATPFEALAAFDGAPTAGTWTLVVTDLRPEVAGTLTSWCLDFGDGP